jgi:putative SOS response-associated peptidase YedK
MCGAFSILHPFRDVSGRFNAGYNDSREIPRYNVRPTQPIPTILNTNPKEITYSYWGIHPFYDKTKKQIFINARNDSLYKTTWKRLAQEQRCLVIADGFYEWQKQAKSKVKIPYRFELSDQGLFAFAGLWQEEVDASGKYVPHCVIITTEPNTIVEDVHDRMPVILKPELEQEWLNPDTTYDEALEMLLPYSTKAMHKYPVSTLVNSPANDSPEIIKPIQLHSEVNSA